MSDLIAQLRDAAGKARSPMLNLMREAADALEQAEERHLRERLTEAERERDAEAENGRLAQDRLARALAGVADLREELRDHADSVDYWRRGWHQAMRERDEARADLRASRELMVIELAATEELFEAAEHATVALLRDARTAIDNENRCNEQRPYDTLLARLDVLIKSTER